MNGPAGQSSIRSWGRPLAIVIAVAIMGIAVAAGLLWSWPSVFAALKPTVLPLALIGIRHRSWWIAAAGLGLASLLLLPLWPQYVTAIRNVTEVTLFYSTNLVLILAPLAVWAGRRRESRAIGPAAIGPAALRSSSASS